MHSYINLATDMFLTEVIHKDDHAKLAAFYAKQMGLTHLGGGYYGKNPDQPATHKSEKGKLVPLSPEEQNRASDAIKQSPGGEDPTQRNRDTKNTASSSSQKPKKSIPTTVGQRRYDKTDFAASMETRFNDALITFKSSLQARREEAIFKRPLEEMYTRLKNISLLNSGPLRKERLEKFISDYKITSGENIIVSNQFPRTGGLYRIFGKRYGQDAEFFEQMCSEDGIDIPSALTKRAGIKMHLTGQSKPKYTTVHDYNDPTVKEIFSRPSLNVLSPMFKKLYGPTNSQGKLLRAGGMNAREHFRHSVENNIHVEQTITALLDVARENAEPEDSTTGYMGVAKALMRHQTHLQQALSEFDSMPAAAREIYVGQIYAKLASDMHDADPEIAGSIMKNVAEHALYDIETAAGEEVYLPSDGSFPVGDKVVVYRNSSFVEHVETVSVKFGKNSSRSYGIPSEAGKLLLYHPDPQYHTALDSRMGRTGYEMGVVGNIINSEDEFNYHARVSGFADCITTEGLQTIRNIAVETSYSIRAFKQSRRGKRRLGELTNKELGMIELDPTFKSATAKLYAELTRSIDHEKFKQLIGSYNYSLLMRKDKNIHSFFSIMVFASALRTSGGFSSVRHNHQEYVSGKLVSQTDRGTDTLSDWYMQWQPFGERGGGLKMGFNKQETQR